MSKVPDFENLAAYITQFGSNNNNNAEVPNNEILAWIGNMGDEHEQNFNQALVVASFYGYADIVEALLKKTAINVNYRYELQNGEVMTPLKAAISTEQLAIIELLVLSDDIDLELQLPYTPMMQACQKCNPNIVALLFDAAASTDANLFKLAPLVGSNNIEIGPSYFLPEQNLLGWVLGRKSNASKILDLFDKYSNNKEKFNDIPASSSNCVLP